MEVIGVNPTLLEAIKNFMDDLSNITDNKNFEDYRTIVNRIDTTKVKSYAKLINGFKKFFDGNTNLQKGLENFKSLSEPYIEYTTDNGAFVFDFQQVYNSAQECEQDTIKDHLNHIWNLLNNGVKSPEELYIDTIFENLKSKFSTDLTREEQMTIVKDLFTDFQREQLDVSVIIKVACKKARETLISNGADDHSKILSLLDTVEQIDVNNFDMLQFMGLVGQVGTVFSTDESGLNGILASILSNSSSALEMETLSLEDTEEKVTEDH